MKILEKASLMEPRASMTDQFLVFAKEFYLNWLIVTDTHQYEIMGGEFLLKTDDNVHNDPFVDGGELQKKFGYWYFPDNGVDFTFGTENYAGALFITDLKEVESGKLVQGAKLVFKLLFQNAGRASDGRHGVRLVRRADKIDVDFWAVPRIRLPVEHYSSELKKRLQYAFKPYRIVRTDLDDIPEKLIAYLHISYVQSLNCTMDIEVKRLPKYLEFYEKGLKSESLEAVWLVTSKAHRMAMLLGYLHANNPDWVD